MRRAAVLLVLAVVPLVRAAGEGVASGGRVVRVDAPPRTEVRVPAGKFLMGVDQDTAGAAISQCELLFPHVIASGPTRPYNFCGDYADELAMMSPRTVYLDEYAIDRDEVSVAAYRRCVMAGACKLDPLVDGDERYIRDEWPLVNVTWFEASDYCRWRGARLPTEAEWERAARGDDPEAAWPWGRYEQPNDFNHGQGRAHATRAIERMPDIVPRKFFGDPDDSDGALLLAPPGSYVWGESPWGTRDQAGNAAEWTADAFVSDTRKVLGYAGLGAINPLRDGSASDPRVVRGGSWRQPAFFARSTLRDPFNRLYEPARRFSHVGFRCARTLR